MTLPDFEKFKTYADIWPGDRRHFWSYKSDSGVLDWAWFELATAFRYLPGKHFESVIVSVPGFYVDKTEIVMGIDGEEIARFAVDRDKWLEDKHYPFKEVRRIYKELVDKRLEGLDWSEYFGITPPSDRSSEQPQ